MFSLAWILFLLKVTPLCLFHLGLPARGKKPITVCFQHSVCHGEPRQGRPRGLGESGETGQGRRSGRLMIALSSDHASDSFLGRKVSSREGALWIKAPKEIHVTSTRGDCKSRLSSKRHLG